MVVCVRSTASCSLSDRSATVADVFSSAALFSMRVFYSKQKLLRSSPQSKQLPQLLRLLDERKGNGNWRCTNSAKLRRSYDQLLLEPVTVSQRPAAPLTEVSQRLVLGEGIYWKGMDWVFSEWTAYSKNHKLVRVFPRFTAKLFWAGGA